MSLRLGHPGYLAKLSSALRSTEGGQAERLIGTARVVLALSGLVAVYLDPTQPSRFAAVAYGLLVFYAVHSLAVLGFLRVKQQPHRAVGVTLHVLDLVWAWSITLLTEGPSSPFFVLFVFLLVAAAYRWGLRATLATAFVSVLLLWVQVLVVTHPVGRLEAFIDPDFELNRVVIRAAYLALIGVLVGYLAEAEKTLRAEWGLVARLLGKARAEIHFADTLRFLLREIVELFDAEGALLVTLETRTDRAFAWKARKGQKHGQLTLDSYELDDTARRSYLFPRPANAWLSKESRATNRLDSLGMDGDGLFLGKVCDPYPELFLEQHRFRSVAVVTYGASREWSGRLFLFEPSLGASDQEPLRFLQRLVNTLAPAVYNLHLMRRLRSQASAMERARVARELHDGALQTLISVEMQVEALRRRAPKDSTQLDGELSRLRELLRQSVVQVRELMQQLKPLEFEPRQFIDFLASAVQKFEHDTGIAARFHSQIHEVRLRPRVAHELARIVQEALVNVRKHSRATSVDVRFGLENSSWRLVVHDDGKGFDFSGRTSSANHDSKRRVPMVIEERVRSINGELVVDSSPGKGARLEITVPQIPELEP